MKINLEDNKGQIITSYEIQEDDTLENIDGFYEVKGGKMKIRSRCHNDKEGEDQKELDTQETYEQNVQDYMDYKFQAEEEATCRNER